MIIKEVTDTSRIKTYITALFTELFGEEAVPSDDVFKRIFSQLATNSTQHQMFEILTARDTSLGHEGNTYQDNEKDVAGFFTLSESFAIFAHGHYGIINELWIKPERRSEGIGESVIKEIQRLGRQKGWRRIDVTAPASSDWDRTFEFYKKCGFEMTGRKLKIFTD